MIRKANIGDIERLTELFNAVKQFGKERGCDTVQLGVNAQNADALKFYEKMGLSPRTIQMEKRI